MIMKTPKYFQTKAKLTQMLMKMSKPNHAPVPKNKLSKASSTMLAMAKIVSSKAIARSP